MSVRLNKLLREANIGLQAFSAILKALDIDEPHLEPSTKISDELANLILNLRNVDLDFIKLIEKSVEKNVSDSAPKSPLKILGTIALDEYGSPGRAKRDMGISSNSFTKAIENYTALEEPQYKEGCKNFWIEELILLTPQGKATRLPIAYFGSQDKTPLYSVLIGCNGVGKSTLLKEMVDFFVDLHAYINNFKQKMSSANKARLKGVKYHIDGVCCEVIRIGRTFLAKVDNRLLASKKLRVPTIVACNFGAFDKFPVQKVNGSSQTRYDVPYYKYVGAHVNGNMISSSAIAFRLLFALKENMDDRQRKNLSSILDFIGYDHTITLNYSIVLKSKKNGSVYDHVLQHVQKDKEYSKLTSEQRSNKVRELYDFYKNKEFAKQPTYNYDIDIDQNSLAANEDLNYIYKLKQYDLVQAASVVFYKNGTQIASEEMSSGEFAMLSMVLSISTASSDSHTLILIDEPELSLHPNWQMTIIDNLDRALKDQVCHLLIATHSHMLVSDLPMNRSSVSQWEKDDDGNLIANRIGENTYGWSAEEVLLKVFKTATDRNRYFGERIAKLLEQMGNDTISKKAVADELNELQEISQHLSDVDPMKMVLNTIIDAYK
jgi:hypothetical protein